ncbi:MAG: tetratricopeptide repeat protein [Flavobacteriales bacterium]|nr:tetratricopeptide repeat protein [Flavobacteriales bacterium]
MSRKERLRRGLAVLSVLVLFGLMWVLPHKADEKTAGGDSSPSVEQKLAEAVRDIQQGTNPMEGIRKLREILEEDPDNIEALTAMGYFSLMSGQGEKAVARFKQILELQPDNQEAWFFMGDALMMQADTPGAINAYKTFLDVATDSAAKEKARTLIESLE